MPEETRPLECLSLEGMIEHIKARLNDPQEAHVPRYTMVLGAGFSWPIIPSGEMMLDDIAWWLYLREKGELGRYYETLSAGGVPLEYKKSLWANVHTSCKGKFSILDSFPAQDSTDNISSAYQALMSGCSPDPPPFYVPGRVRVSVAFGVCGEGRGVAEPRGAHPCPSTADGHDAANAAWPGTCWPSGRS